MKTIIPLVFLTLSSLICKSQNTPAELGVAAIGLVVEDIEASEKFYTEIVGMVPAGGFALDSQWSNEAGAANGKPIKVNMYKMLNSPSATVLKLAYFDKMDPRPKQSGIDEFAGVNYITLNYTKEGFLAAVDKVKSADIEIIGWVKRDTYQLIFIRDPNGVFVELVGPPTE